MTTFHLVVGVGLLVSNLVAGLWGLLVYRGTLRAGRVYAQVLALAHTLVVGQAMLGLLLLGGERRAADSIHYVYGLAPLVLVGFAYSARTEDARRNVLVFSLSALVVAGLAARAWTTGM